MKGQNYTTIVEHKTVFIIPYIFVELENISLLVVLLTISGVVAGIFSLLFPALFIVWILIAIGTSIITALIFGERDEDEGIPTYKRVYYESFKNYRYIFTPDGKRHYLKPRVITQDYKQIK